MPREGLFFTVVYPQALSFFNDFCSCARRQTLSAFDVLVVNDGCEAEDIENSLSGLSYTIIPAIGSPSENRQQGINYARKRGYEYLLFCDADDTFCESRYEKTIQQFQRTGADIIVCNLNIVDNDLSSIIDDYFSLEIPEDRTIDIDFIREKNIFGMSNTALRLDSLKEDVVLPHTPITDWYLFTVLLEKGLSAYYISESFVDYRQHSANMIGINCFDVPTFKRLSKFKVNHYQTLVNNGILGFEDLLTDTQGLLDLSDEQITSIINKQLVKHSQPLWWQIITVEK